MTQEVQTLNKRSSRNSTETDFTSSPKKYIYKTFSPTGPEFLMTGSSPAKHIKEGCHREMSECWGQREDEGLEYGRTNRCHAEGLK